MLAYSPMVLRPAPAPDEVGPPVPPPSGDLRFGVNLPSINYYTPLSEIYRNLVPGANGFTLGGSATTINATDGYPTTDFQFLPAAIPTAEATNGRIKGDVSSITYSGGSVTLGAYNAGTNTRTFTINNNVAGAWEVLTLNGTKRTAAGTPGEGVQEIIILRPGDTDFDSVSDRSQLFTDKFLTHLANFPGPLRAMDYFSTNNNVADRGPNDRATIANSRTNSCYLNSTTTPQAEGVMGRPEEDHIALCEAAEKDAWVCIPVGANDAYVSAIAARYLAGLTLDQKVYVELGNELWNNAFAACTYIRHKVCDEMSGYYDYDASGGDPYRIMSFFGNAGTTVTITVPAARPHGLVVGDKIWTYPGEYTVTNVASTTVFTMDFPGVTGEQPKNSSFSMMKKTTTTLRRGPNFGDDWAYSVYELATRWITRRLTEVSDLWRAVWGDGEMNGASGRVRVIFGDQIGYYPADAQFYFDDMAALFPARDVNEWIWGLAGAPYCGYKTISPTDSNPALTEAMYIADMGSYIVDGNVSLWWERRKCTCLMYGLRSVCYEGGPDSFGDAGATNNQKKNQGNFDATMKPYYDLYLAKWYRLGGDDFVWYHGDFQAENSTSQYGCWAVATFCGDTTTAKMAAILERLANGLPTITRNVAAVGTQTDGRLMTDHFQEPATPTGAFPSLSNATTDYPHQGRGSWLVYSATAQTINLSFVYTCDLASTANLSINGVTVGSTLSFSATPADQTTLKETAATAVNLLAGWNAVFLTRVVNADARINALKWS